MRRPARAGEPRPVAAAPPCDADRVTGEGKMLQSRQGQTAATCSLSRTLATGAAPSVTPSDLAWRVIGLLSLYRLLVPLLLLAMQSLAGPPWGVMAARPNLVVGACIAFFSAAVSLVIARRVDSSRLRIVALVNAHVA